MFMLIKLILERLVDLMLIWRWSLATSVVHVLNLLDGDQSTETLKLRFGN